MTKNDKGLHLITGAAGFIGTACAREFLARDERVAALIHRSSSPFLEEAEKSGRLIIVRADIADPESLRSAIFELAAQANGPLHSVVHCAAIASDVGPEKLFRRTNLGGVENLCALLEELNIGRLVFISTTDVYGLRDFRGADEGTPYDPNPSNPYPKYKILAEKHICGNLAPDRWVILRPAAVWGPGDKSILPRVVGYLRNAPAIVHFGKWRGRNRWPMAYSGNVARAAWLAATRKDVRGKVFNVIDPESATAEEYYRLVLEVCLPERRSMRSVTLPYWAGWLLGAASTTWGKIARLKEPPFDPTLYSLASASKNLSFDARQLDALFEAAGEKYIPRAEALSEFKAWWDKVARCGGDSCAPWFR